MNYRLLFLLTVSLVAMGTATAQQMYKSVGPDGKITYSDRPSDSASAKVSVMKSYVLRPVDQAPPALAAGASASASAAAATDGAHGAKKAAPAGTAPALLKGGIPLEVEKAVAGVMLLADLFRRSELLCSAALPTSSQRYNNSLSKWRDRNASFLDKQKHILMEVVSPIQRAALQSTVADTNERSMEKVASAPIAARIKWCDKGFIDVDSGQHDIANSPALSVPLITFNAHN